MKIHITLISVLFCLLSISCSTTNVEKSMSETSTTIYLVRHAEKMDDGTSDPPLTTEGRARAKKLSTLLSGKQINHIYSSDYKRTQQTAIPISKRTKIAIKSYNPRELDVFANQISQLKGQHILVVGHSNSTPSLANLLLGREEYTQYDESDYGNLIEVEISGNTKKSKKTRF